MNAELRLRDAARPDASVIAAIGSEAMSAQYAGLIDPTAVQAAVEQSYAVEAVESCIERCRSAGDAHFLVAERGGGIVGYLHFDAFGPEPELHRLYVHSEARSAGVGDALMRALHARLAPAASYMLLVVAGNDRAIRFYERHGLHVVEHVDGLTYYRERMGVEFPAGTRSFRFALMRYPGSRSGPTEPIAPLTR